MLCVIKDQYRGPRTSQGVVQSLNLAGCKIGLKFPIRSTIIWDPVAQVHYLETYEAMPQVRAISHDSEMPTMPNGLKDFWWRTWRFINSWYFYACLLVLLPLILSGVGVLIWKWDWLRALDETKDSNSNTLGNVALIGAGFLALAFAAWRAKIADSQSRTAQRQADTAQRGLLNERYQKGAEMLGNSVLATRMGGIYALHRLAEEHPNEYHVQIMRLLCAFARYPTVQSSRPGADVREDVQSVMYAIRACRQKDIALELEKAENYRPNLTRAYLRGADLSGINLSNTDLPHADLSRGYLGQAVLSGAYLFEANLSGATFTGTNMCGADLSGASLNTAYLMDRTAVRINGLTQRQLDCAYADSNMPPSLEALDSETSDTLVWNNS